MAIIVRDLFTAGQELDAAGLCYLATAVRLAEETIMALPEDQRGPTTEGLLSDVVRVLGRVGDGEYTQ
ncbi:hypothetical protein [Candidatus Solirubrobacter pratensis]|uniref:hypothetical protein n=1 Tax=Candidatus Solirubrobacter pratensis TaxID=1298857 RepID=UPI00047F1258|nr:hypothetical protein [Candidatus Solirubrobacter pratensis]